MKKLLIIVLANLLIIAFIYSTYFRSRKTTTEIPKGVNVVTDEEATPEDKVLYGIEYTTVNVSIFLEEGISESVVNSVQEVMALFPAKIIRSLPRNNINIYVVTNDSVEYKENSGILVVSTDNKINKDKFIYELCDYAYRYHNDIFKLEYVNKEDKEYFIESLSEYVNNKESLREHDPEICSYYEEMFKEDERIEEILN